MADLINLNKARKRRARAEAETIAAANRLRFGRTKAEKLRDASDVEEAKRRHDLLHRETPPDGAS